MLGVNLSGAYTWIERAGLVLKTALRTSKRTTRVYTQLDLVPIAYYSLGTRLTMEMRARTKRACVITVGSLSLSLGVVLWLIVGREREFSHVLGKEWGRVQASDVIGLETESGHVTQRQCLGLGENGESCVYHCDHGDEDCLEYASRLERYCHYSLLTTREGGEGHLPSQTSDSEPLELVHVNMVVRHGDRTPANPYRFSPPVESYRCELTDGDPKWSGLSDFKLVPLRSSGRNSLVSLTPSKKCAVGRLTQTGYKQEYALGSLLGRKYHVLRRTDPAEMYVQTTYIPRTYRSAGAFLLGFLPDKAQVRQSTAIHVSPTVLTEVPPPGVKMTYGTCKKFRSLWEKDLDEIEYYRIVREKFQTLVERFAEMFSLAGGSDPIVHKFADLLQVRGCHIPHDPLPCNGKGQCVNYTFARQLSVAADWTWEHHFPRNSSLVALLPFLKHSVFDVMDNLVARETVAKETPAYKVYLTFTHDDFLHRLRSVLGLATVEWVPYASRLVFELWRRPSSDPVYYIRVLFNGDVVTNMIKLRSSRTEFEHRHNLIEYQTLRDDIMTHQLADLPTYHKLCGVRKG